jgi:hypothetical protein
MNHLKYTQQQAAKPAQPRAAAEPFKKSEVGSSLNLKKIKTHGTALIKKIIKTKYLAAAAEVECMYKYYSTAAHYQIQIIMGAVLVGSSSSIRVGPVKFLSRNVIPENFCRWRGPLLAQKFSS